MKTALLGAGIAGLTGVMLGAFGAHALKDVLAAKGSAAVWQTAVLYQLTHAVAALAVTLFAQTCVSAEARGGRWLGRASTCWLIGIGLFSGSLYALALGGPRWLGPVTPLGGLFLLGGWGCVCVAACKITPKKKGLNP